MTIYFSKSNIGFYDSDIHAETQIPSDSIEITEEERSRLINGQASGKIISVGDDGIPYLKDLAPYPYAVWDDVGKCWCRGTQATLKAISGKKDEIISIGYFFNGNHYQLREIDISNYQSILLALSLGQVNPHDGIWRTMENTDVSFTDAEIGDLALNAIKYKGDILRAWAAHKDAVSVMDDETAEDYDITQGWPSNV